MDKNCQLCSKQFSFLFQSKYKCKRCSLNVCSQCIRQVFKVIIYNQLYEISSNMLKPLKTEKVCAQCRSDCRFQYDLRQEMKFNWNSKSDFQTLLSAIITDEDQTYKKHKDSSKSLLNHNIYQEQIKKDLINCFIASEFFNYSFQDWIVHSIQNKNTNTVFQDIITLVLAFLNKNQHIGYSQDLFMVSVILLTLMQDYMAFKFLDIFYMMLPIEYHPKNQMAYDHNCKKYLSSYQMAFKIDPIQLPSLKKFIEYSSIISIQSLFIKLLNFSAFYTILEDLIEKLTFNEMEKYLLVIAKLNIRTVNKCGLEFKGLGKEIMRNTEFKSIRQVKEILDHKIDNLPLIMPTPMISRNCSFINQESPIQIREASFSSSSITGSQTQIEGTYEDSFIFSFQNEQNQQIKKLNQLIESKKQELQELQDKNLNLKLQLEAQKQERSAQNEQYIETAIELGDEIQQELRKCLQYFQATQ